MLQLAIGQVQPVFRHLLSGHQHIRLLGVGKPRIRIARIARIVREPSPKLPFELGLQSVLTADRIRSEQASSIAVV